MTAAIALGSYILLSFGYSLFAIFHTRKAGTRTRILSIFNITIVLAAVSTMAIGTAVWFFTLRQRADFETVWIDHSSEVKQFLQDSLQCCGYWNATAAGLSSLRLRP